MISRLFAPRAAFLFDATTLFTSSAARADTYHVYDLGAANSIGVFGIDDAGTVVLSAGGGTPGCSGGGPCYRTYVDGVQTAYSTTVPALAYDNGSPCTISGVPPGTVYGTAMCNGSREAYDGLFPTVQGLFSGPDPVADLVVSGTTINNLVLNAVGDIAWTDGAHEENFEAVDLTPVAVSPEPASLALLGTGAMAAVGVMRRRMGRRS